ncbi:hypothetical protein F511_13747 [Dorcoceras hygrometricum]|uniref:Uncharacterized protein n=1 Tax=Dorcoceras hygrometricum TaxID=472368 RepID=A0A2Z7CI39_9LAMI|nr:hypothetical protein F511_13747 [Dorcoceras hygrometricum]
MLFLHLLEALSPFVHEKGCLGSYEGSENWYHELSHSSGINSWIENTDNVFLKGFGEQHAKQIVPKLNQRRAALHAGTESCKLKNVKNSSACLWKFGDESPTPQAASTPCYTPAREMCELQHYEHF